jgi:putative transposase
MTQRAYRYRFYPTAEQENLLRRTLGCARLVYNRALAARTEGWYERQERIGYKETSAMLTEWKRDESLDFLNDVSCVPLQQGLRHLQKAFANFWAGRTQYPTFRKKRNGGSAEFTKSAFRWKNGQLFLAKCQEPLPIRWSRQLPQGATPSTVTIRQDAAGRWFVSLLVDAEIEPLPPVSKKVGIDLGVTSLIVTSDGTKVANPKTFKVKHKRLKRAQKALARKQKGSNNRHQARLKVAKLHAEIVDSRKDFLHKLTTQLVRDNQTIAVEDLNVKGMVKNHTLAQSISDASWGELVRQLTYKCEWYGRELVKIDRWFPSSKRCSCCGHIAEKMPLNVRNWVCPQCETKHERDVNAANNILAAGLAVSVCGATIRPEQSKSVKAGATKQKPRS